MLHTGQCMIDSYFAVVFLSLFFVLESNSSWQVQLPLLPLRDNKYAVYLPTFYFYFRVISVVCCVKRCASSCCYFQYCLEHFACYCYNIKVFLSVYKKASTSGDCCSHFPDPFAPGSQCPSPWPTSNTPLILRT